MNIPQKQFKGVFIPAEIWEDDNLSWTDRCLLGEIWSLTGDDGCFASNEYLAGKFGITEASMKNKISDLRKKGYLVTVKFDGRKRWMKTCWDVTAGVMKNMTSEVIESMTPEVTKNMTHSNKYSNKLKNKDSSSVAAATRTTTPPLLFKGQIWSLNDLSDAAADRVVEQAIRYGLNPERVDDFMQGLEARGNQLTVRSKGPIPGLKDIVEAYNSRT